MAAGDLDARLLPSFRDQVGQLTRAFNHMADRIREQMTQPGRGTGPAGRRAGAHGQRRVDNRWDWLGPVGQRRRGRLAGHERGAGRWGALSPRWGTLTSPSRAVESWPGAGRGARSRLSSSAAMGCSCRPSSPLSKGRPSAEATCSIVLQDLTRIRRLETVRRDFISNISHELRTPLAGLKALVDTLRGGAIEGPARRPNGS